MVIASWAAGVEVLISTKTMLSSYAKNLRNRFEEGYGDAKNLRGRHPLSSLGFLSVAGADIPDQELDFAIDMLRKLTSGPDVSDCCCLLLFGVADKAEITESGAAERSIADEAPREPNTEVELVHDRTPEDLSAGAFFRRLVSKALTHMPVSVYTQVRERQATATH